eukprot:CAMPEP_0184691832 /NCGR_PEP_ID=MMETSP0313-20130426/553_1 /TAXON_ID=2792 /ORGANISM="Porphyridium aerugineum, Strain SAG 1380-2" /LENGTH=74 /DNA_ID=CAMNT_0027149597 /DNA_START=158 /DNA_END=382 /DNA_ORIENTATION=+
MAPRSRIADVNGMVAIREALYNTLFRRTTTYALTVVVAGYTASSAFGNFFDYVWESHNKGKLWKDVVKTLPSQE